MMKVKYNRPCIFNAQYLEVILQGYSVYPEDWVVNGNDDYPLTDLPFYVKDNDTFVIFIDISDGRVLEWEEGNVLDVCAKVRDEGEYWLCDDLMVKTVKSTGRYVPKMLDTRGDGGGDYIQFKINEAGYIENWKVDFDKFSVDILN